MDAVDIDLIRLVVQVTPLLGAALAGPANGMVCSLISNVFSSKKDQDLVEEIKSDPDAENKLKKIESDHEIDLKKLSLQQSAIDTLNSIIHMHQNQL